jgi:spore cortex formation protein SpoVR/YcgB (stage V sporulation)
VQLLAAAVTTLLNGMAAATAGTFLTERLLDACHALGSSLLVILQACKEIWVEGRSSKDNQERQKLEQQVAESGARTHSKSVQLG